MKVPFDQCEVIAWIVDGALGAHATAAREARADFEKVANRIAAATWRPGKQPKSRSRS